MIKNSEYYTSSFFLSRGLFLGIGYKLMFNESGKSILFSSLLGMIIGIFLIKSIYNLSKFKDNLLLKYLKLFILIFILLTSILSITSYIISFYLFDSNFYLIIIPLFLLLIYSTGLKNNAEFKTANILIVLRILIFILVILGLLVNIKTKFFIFNIGNNYTNIIKSSLIFAFLTVAPYLTLTNYMNNISSKKVIINYIINALLVILLLALIISVLGIDLISLYRYPEYMALKKISILDFINNYENIFSIGYLLDNFMILIITLNYIKKNYKKPTVAFIILLLFLYLICFIKFNMKYVIISYNYLPYMIIIFLSIYLLFKYLSTRHQD